MALKKLIKIVRIKDKDDKVIVKTAKFVPIIPLLVQNKKLATVVKHTPTVFSDNTLTKGVLVVLRLSYAIFELDKKAILPDFTLFNHKTWEKTNVKKGLDGAIRSVTEDKKFERWKEWVI
jgi:hypothetical protein